MLKYTLSRLGTYYVGIRKMPNTLTAPYLDYFVCEHNFLKPDVYHFTAAAACFVCLFVNMSAAADSHLFDPSAVCYYFGQGDLNYMTFLI